VDADLNKRLQHDQQESLIPANEPRCPAYGKDCNCPADSAIRSICERTAANIYQ
jgi:hypothetical protein